MLARAEILVSSRDIKYWLRPYFIKRPDKQLELEQRKVYGECRARQQPFGRVAEAVDIARPVPPCTRTRDEVC